MRQYDIAKGDDVTLVAGLNELTVNGPRYKLTSQSQILRLLFSSFRWQINTPAGDLGIYEARMLILINTVTAAKDLSIICPLIATSSQWLQEFPGTTFAFVGGSQSFGFDCRNRDIRGDDFPNLGGVNIAPAGKNGFSVAVNFYFEILEGPAGGDVISPYFSVLADISDFSEIANRRL